MFWARSRTILQQSCKKPSSSKNIPNHDGGGGVSASAASASSSSSRCFTTSSSSSSKYSLLTWYSKKLDTHPYTTKGITSGLISLSGDVTCQYLTAVRTKIEEDGTTTEITAPYDYGRSIRFFIMGTFWVAPITNFWYQALSTKIIPGSTRTIGRIVKRLMVDQFVFAPIFVNSFMGCLWLLEGKSPSEIVESIQEVAVDMIVANWSLWIPAMAINFSVVPLRYQVLFGNVVALVWNVYLSWMSAAGSDSKKEESLSS